MLVSVSSHPLTGALSWSRPREVAGPPAPPRLYCAGCGAAGLKCVFYVPQLDSPPLCWHGEVVLGALARWTLYAPKPLYMAECGPRSNLRCFWRTRRARLYSFIIARADESVEGASTPPGDNTHHNTDLKSSKRTR